MKAFRTHTGLVAPLDRANVDTDQIIPKQFLKRIERTGFGEFLFYDWRRKPDRTLDPNFPLNQPRYSGASILVADRNFGCGSSREHAPWALDDFGFRAIIAPSFADIFANNCVKNGLLTVVLPEAQVATIMKRAQEVAGYRVTVDLEQRQVRDDLGLAAPFTMDDFSRRCLLEGLDDIGLTLQHEAEIAAYEARRSSMQLPSSRRMKFLFSRPAGCALLQECRDAFLRVSGHGIHRHDFFRVGIGLGLVEIDLRVEGLLADPDGERAGIGDARSQLAGFSLERTGGHHVVHQSPLGGDGGRDHVAGEQHLQRALAANGAAEGHHRRGAEQADLDAGRGERGFFAGDGEVAGGDKLAAGGGGDALYFGDHRLRDGLQLHHQLRANVEGAAIVVEVLAHHLSEIVAGGKHLSCRGQDHHPQR